MPDDAEVEVEREWLLVTLRTDWAVGGRTYAAGSLIAADFEGFLKGAREVDVLFRDARNGNRLAVEAKYQRVKGTADEKLPYAVLNQETLPLPSVIVYGGGGFHLGALHWLCANARATDIAGLAEWLTVFFAL